MATSSLLVPKHGNSPRECEDALHVRSDAEVVCAAVSDGASESLLAGEWADLLARSVNDAARDDGCVLRDADRFAAALVDAGEAWREWVAGYVAEREAGGRPIAWYEQPKLDRGPHAAVLAARFDADPSGPVRWHAAALGDSCLFRVGDDELLLAFPVGSSGAFDNSPGLVNAFNRDQDLLTRHTHTSSGEARPGDQFFLCTDALAAWFLHQAERDQHPWRVLAEFTRSGDLDGFTSWLTTTRAEGVLRNDDVAVVHVDLG